MLGRTGAVVTGEENGVTGVEGMFTTGVPPPTTLSPVKGIGIGRTILPVGVDTGTDPTDGLCDGVIVAVEVGAVGIGAVGLGAVGASAVGASAVGASAVGVGSGTDSTAGLGVVGISAGVEGTGSGGMGADIVGGVDGETTGAGTGSVGVVVFIVS